MSLHCIVACAGFAALVAMSDPARAAEVPATGAQADGGRATIRCVVGDRARLEDCVVLTEEPAGGGFGRMAFEASKKMRFRGPGARGGTVTIPMTFKAPVSRRR
jgi:TonB family protein